MFNGFLRQGSSANQTVSSNLSGSYSLTKTGTGTLTLSGNNSHTGGNTISAGTVSIAAASALGTGPTTVNGTLTVTAGTTISTVLAGSGSIGMSTGNLLLTGTNTFSGTITVTGGNLIAESNASSMGGQPKLALNGGSFVIGVVYVGGTCTIGDLSGNSAASTINPAYNATIGTRRLAINQTGTTTYQGLVQDAGGSRFIAVTKNGAGQLTLSGNNTYTGGTIVNAGTIKAGHINAFGTGGITVNAGGTLDKGGFAITNTVTNNGGTVID